MIVRLESPPAEPAKYLSLDRVRHWSQTTPTVDAIRFLEAGEEVTERLNYATLWKRICHHAACLSSLGLKGKPVVLIYEAGPDFILAFLGCMLAGVIAAPLPVPRQERARRRFRSVMDFLKPNAILTTSRLRSLSDIDQSAINTLCTDDGLVDDLPCFHTDISAETPAVIQFSSGSTGTPRGIVLTQGNIAANISMIHQVFRISSGSVCVSWLPHHHDMGLFGTILAVLTAGATIVQMPPEIFLRRPLRWLTAISTHRADIAGAPNFGYAICNRRITARSIVELDLSTWQIAFTGGEPPQPKTFANFANLTKAAGFREESFLTCYGLAEATLLCSAGTPCVVDTRLTGGTPAPGCRMILRPLPQDIRAEGGEICISGEHVSPGLWTEGPNGHLAPHVDWFEGPDGRRYLPTGDIGIFIDDQILICDRLKDILPIRGSSIGPYEIEALVMLSEPRIETAAAVRGPDSQPDNVHLALEVNLRTMSSSEQANMTHEIKTTVAAAFGIQINISFHASGRLPRTTSGKVQRFATRQMIARTVPEAYPQQGFDSLC